MWQKLWDKILELFGKPPEYNIRAVDLEAELDARAEEDGRGLKWRSSVVDLLTLLDIDSSSANREELAIELGVKEMPVGSAGRNEALRKAVYKEIAANGGRVPADLLD